MKKLTLIFGLALVATIGSTAQAATHEHYMSQHQMTTQATVKHEGRGVLKAINANAGKVQIAHEPIAALGWPSMTMWFALRVPLPDGTMVGDVVRFKLEQINSKEWVITRIEHNK